MRIEGGESSITFLYYSIELFLALGEVMYMVRMEMIPIFRSSLICLRHSHKYDPLGEEGCQNNWIHFVVADVYFFLQFVEIMSAWDKLYILSTDCKMH